MKDNLLTIYTESNIDAGVYDFLVWMTYLYDNAQDSVGPLYISKNILLQVNILPSLNQHYPRFIRALKK